MVVNILAIPSFVPFFVGGFHIILYVLLTVPSALGFQRSDTFEDVTDDRINSFGADGTEKLK